MKNEQLLNENEITKIVGWPSAFEYAKIIEIVTAQDRKTTAARDKEWVKRIEDYFGQGILCGFWPKHCDNCTISDGCLMLKWQSLKQSMNKEIENEI
jgi:hypothetical protein